MKIDLIGDIHKTAIIKITGSSQELDLQSENAVFGDEVSVACAVHRDENFTRIEAEVTVMATFECGRCLEGFSREITGSFEIVARHLKQGQSPPEETVSDDDEDIPEDILCLPYGEMSIDITGDVRDAILLEVPYKVLCKEDCKGLCPQCGMNLNDGSCECVRQPTDSRWQALSGLIHEKKKNKNS